MVYAQLKLELTPGPNVFFPHSIRTGVNKGPAFSLQGGFRKNEKAYAEENLDSPGNFINYKGPGKYNPNYLPTTGSRAPAYSLCPRRAGDKCNFVF